MSNNNQVGAEKLLEINGITVSYTAMLNDQSKLWVILILPLGMKLDLAQAFCAYFNSNYNVMTWEGRRLFAEGEIKVTPDDFSLDKHVDDMFTIMAAENIEKAYLVGYCSGAGVALQAINNQPQRFERLALVHGEYTILKDKTCMTQAGKDLDSLFPIVSMSEDKAKFVLEKLPPMESKSPDAIPPGALLPYSNPRYFYRYANFYLTYKSVDYLALAQQTHCPTLVLCGDLDTQTNVASSKKIASLLPEAQIMVDPSADHYGILRHDSSTLSHVASFLSQ